MTRPVDQKTILITGSTDGIGLETAKLLAAAGQRVLLHGRNPDKLARAAQALHARVERYAADLSIMSEVEALARQVSAERTRLDVLINNSGVFSITDPVTRDGLDARFAVNAIAPYLLTQRLLPLLGAAGRVINVSSAAQSPVDRRALAGDVRLSDDAAYAQSKLALTMWSRSLARSLEDRGPAVVAVNPGSMLGSKMVQQAYGVTGGDLRIGAEILARAALDGEFGSASGAYFDNDAGRFASPHPDAVDPRKCATMTAAIETVLDATRRRS